MLGKTEVVADERGDSESRPREVDDLVSGRMRRRLTAERERLELAVPRKERSVGAERQRLVGRPAADRRYQSADHGAGPPPGQVTKEALGRRRVAHRLSDVEAEPGKRHLWEHDEITGPNLNPLEERLDPLPIDVRILPGNVDLHEMGVHRGGPRGLSIHEGGEARDTIPATARSHPAAIVFSAG